jgi:PAS domain S-box-containing protein
MFGLNNLREAAFMVLSNGRFAYVNDEACSSLGYSRSELLALNVWDVDPDFQQGDLGDRWAKLEQEGKEVFEGRHRRKDGSEFPVEVTSSHFEFEGKEYNLALARDITERRTTEHLLQLLFAALDRVQDTILLMENDSPEFLYANEGAAKNLGYTRLELTSGLGIADIDPVWNLEQWDRHRRGRRPPPRVLFETQHKSRSGRVFPVEVAGYNFEFEGRRYTLGICRDISERKHAQEERAVLEAQLRESQKIEAIGTLAGGIAHDFNNILAAILGNVKLAEEDCIHNAPALESLEQIRRAAQRAKDLTQQILLFGRRQATERKVLSLVTVVEQCVQLLRATLPARISLNYRIAPPSPIVLADTTQLLQVLVNLGTNAAQAIGDQPGQIDIVVEPLTVDKVTSFGIVDLMPGSYARIMVRDSGKGMDAATMERIFEPFFTTKKIGEGTGLGLSVVHGIIRTHEGHITVRSEPGKGTTFDIFLPSTLVPKAVVVSEPAAKPATRGNGQHVLCVDDDVSLILLMERLLKRHGFRVTSCTDAGTALAVVRANPQQFDAAVTDFNMPGMTGLQLAQEIRKISQTLPIALASGYITDEMRRETHAAGVQELIYKPNAVDEYVAAIERLISVPVAMDS